MHFLFSKQTAPKKEAQQKKLQVKLEQEEYETDAGLDASLDEDENDCDSDDEQSDTDSETKSSLLHKSAPIMEYEQNLVKRWMTQQKKSPSSPDSNF